MQATVGLFPTLQAGNTVQLTFGSENDSFYAQANSTGTEFVTIPIVVPKDLPGGEYKTNQVLYNPGRHWFGITLPAPITLTVLPMANAPVLPSKATVKLDFDQKQYIRMQAEPIEKIRQDLLQSLANDATDSATLRGDLISAVSKADSLIPAVKEKYLALYAVKPVLDPVVFDDFDIHYRELLVELKAPSWPNPAVSPVSVADTHARLVIVQLKKRPSVPTDEGLPPDTRVLAVYPPYAESVLNLLLLNVRAYRMLAISGVDTFSIRLASRPPGATVYYTRVGQPYQQLSAKTIIDQTTFPYAMWTFKFVLAGCDPYVEEANPYIELHPNIDADLTCKNK